MSKQRSVWNTAFTLTCGFRLHVHACVCACVSHTTHTDTLLTCWHRRDTDWQPLVAGALTAVPLLIETKQRRVELMLYTLPKGVEVCWRYLVSRGVLRSLPGGDSLLFAVALAVFLAVDRQRHKPAFRGLLKLLFGDQLWQYRDADVKVL